MTRFPFTSPRFAGRGEAETRDRSILSLFRGDAFKRALDGFEDGEWLPEDEIGREAKHGDALGDEGMSFCAGRSLAPPR